MVDLTPFITLAVIAVASAVIAFVIQLMMHKSATNTVVSVATTAITSIQATATTVINAQLASEGVEVTSLPTPLKQLKEAQG